MRSTRSRSTTVRAASPACAARWRRPGGWRWRPACRWSPVSSLEALAGGAACLRRSHAGDAARRGAGGPRCAARRGLRAALRAPICGRCPARRRAARHAAARGRCLAVAEPTAGPLRLVGSGAPLVRGRTCRPASPAVIETRRGSTPAGWRRCAARAPRRGRTAAAPAIALRPLYLRAPDARPPVPSGRAGACPGGRGLT